MSSIYHLPFYSSKATGDALLNIAKNFPKINFDVFCGHTHGEAHHQALPNLAVNTGHADFYKPRIARMVTI